MKTKSLYWLLPIVLVGCADGRSLLDVTVSSQNLSGIDHLHIEVTNAKSQMSQPIDVSLASQNHALPPDVVVPLGFDKSVKGTVTITIDAMNASGASIGTKTGTVEITPSKKQTLTIELPANGPPVDLAGADLTARDLAGPSVDLLGADLTGNADDLVGTNDDLLPPDDLAVVPNLGKLQFTISPINSFLGAQMIVQVSLLDSSSALRSSATDTVTLTVAPHVDDTSPAVFGSVSVQAVNGVATFNNVRIDEIGTGLTLVASSPGSDSATSGTFYIIDPTWQGTPTGPQGGEVDFISYDLHSPKVAYAQTQGVLFRTDDATAAGCCTWTKAGYGGATQSAIATSGEKDQAVLVNIYSQVSLSTDKGKTFTPLNNAPSDSVSVAVDRTNGANLWIATTAGQVSRSTDSGATWANWSTGLPTVVNTLCSIAVASGSPAVVVMAVYGAGIYSRAATGSTWTLLGAPLPSGSTADYSGLTLAPDRADSGSVWLTVGGNTFHYHAGDAAWTQPPTQLSSTDLIASIPGTTTYITGNNFQQSLTTDKGATWSSLADSVVNVTSLAADSTTHLLLATLGDGIHQAIGDAAPTAKNTGLFGFDAGNIVPHPKQSGVVFALGVDSYGWYKTSDFGDTWAVPDLEFSTNRIASVAFDPTDANTVYAPLNGVAKSTDGGTTWNTLLDDSNVSSIAVDPTNAMNIYAGRFDGVVKKTVNGGSTWTNANLGLPASVILRLIVDPETPTTVYALAGDGFVYKSINSGSTWTLKNSGQTHGSGLIMDPTNSQQLYVLQTNQQATILKTTDGGESGWVTASTGLQQFAQMFSLSVDPFHPNKLYSLSSAGLYISRDRGDTWAPYTLPFAELAPVFFAIDPQNPGILYYAASSAGILRTNVK